MKPRLRAEKQSKVTKQVNGVNLSLYATVACTDAIVFAASVVKKRSELTIEEDLQSIIK